MDPLPKDASPSSCSPVCRSIASIMQLSLSHCSLQTAEGSITNSNSCSRNALSTLNCTAVAGASFLSLVLSPRSPLWWGETSSTADNDDEGRHRGWHPATNEEGGKDTGLVEEVRGVLFPSVVQHLSPISFEFLLHTWQQAASVICFGVCWSSNCRFEIIQLAWSNKQPFWNNVRNFGEPTSDDVRYCIFARRSRTNHFFRPSSGDFYYQAKGEICFELTFV